MIVITILRYIFFFASCLGWMVYLHKKLKAQAEFLPLILSSLIILVLLVGGLLGLMFYAALAVFVTGAVMFYVYLYKKEMGKFVKENIMSSAGFWFFGAVLVYFTIRLQAASLEHYDDFSHWATLVKEMWMLDWLPNFNSDAIMFRTYPPGSALYVYYFVKSVGFSEPHLLTGQFYLMLTPVLAVSGLIKEKKKIWVAVLFALSCMLIVHPAPDTMLVDTVLALTGLGALAITYCYRNDLKKAAMLSVPPMAAVLLIKNSGLLFAVLNMIYLLYLLVKSRKASGRTSEYKKTRNTVLISIAAALGALVLWKAHTDYVFPYVVTKHSMSLYYFYRSFLNKSFGDIAVIGGLMVDKLKDLSVHTTLMVALINAGMLVSFLIQKLALRRKARGTLTAWITADALFLLYYIALYGMYVFSMPMTESLILAGFDRYMNTIFIYIVGVIAIGTAYDYDAAPKADLAAVKQKRRQAGYAMVSSVVLIVLSAALIHFDFSWFYRSFKKEGTLPQLFVPAIEENRGPSYINTKFALYVSDDYPDDDDYFAFVAQYRLFPKPDPKIYISPDEEENFAEALQRYDELVVLVEDEEIIDFLDDYVTRDSYIGSYDTSLFKPAETPAE